MDKIFSPQQLVVVGVSERADNLGRNIAENLDRYGYRGEVYYLGSRAGELNGRPIHTRVEDLPRGLDLAVILTPAVTVPPLVAQLGAHGVRHMVIETAGFSEFSPEGAVLEAEIARLAEKWGIQVVGPNCIGIINPASGIQTVFVPTEADEVSTGRVALMSQSGGVVLTITDMLTAAGLGVGKTVSVGNKLVLKEPDYLEYFLKDADTDMVLLYLESINEGRRLVELAGESEKAVIVYKSNTSQASAQIAQSHTAALANDDRVVSAAFRQFGISRAHSFWEMMTLGKGFAMPPVRGNRLAVFSRSGGQAIVAVDCAAEAGFSLPPFTDELIEFARPYFRVDVIDRQNPLDLGTVFNFDAYPALIEETLRQDLADAVLLIFNYRRETVQKAREIAETLKQLSQQYARPIALCYFTEMDEVYQLERSLGYPVFTEVSEAVQALAASRDRTACREKRAKYSGVGGNVSIPTGAAEKARTLLSGVKGGEVQIDQAMQVLAAYGLPLAPWAVVHDEAEALQAAAQIGYPLVLKVAAGGGVHKTDVGGVILDIGTDKQLVDALQTMQASLRAHGQTAPARFLLQKMLSGGREVIVGGQRDASFGPQVLFGLGGIYAEVFQDVSIRLAPLHAAEAREMMAEIRGVKLLQGVRGEPPVDMAALEAVLLKVARMMADLEEIAELDLNPVLAFAEGAALVDARMLLRLEKD